MPPKKRSVSAEEASSMPSKRARSNDESRVSNSLGSQASKSNKKAKSVTEPTRRSTRVAEKEGAEPTEHVEVPKPTRNRVGANSKNVQTMTAANASAAKKKHTVNGKAAPSKATPDQAATGKATSGKAARSKTAKPGPAPKKSAPASRGKASTNGSTSGSIEIRVNGTGTTVDSESEAGNDDDEGPEGVSYWLMKAEPKSRFEKGVDVKFSIDDLAAAEEPEPWDGVRNPSARNNMRAMRKGDLAFFYHSNCKVPGIAGIMEISKEHSIDPSQFDPAHPYHDPKSSKDKPKWCLVHVAFRKKLDKFIPLKELQLYSKQGGKLSDMQVLKMARLSVSKVRHDEWKFICQALAGIDPQTLGEEEEFMEPVN